MIDAIDKKILALLQEDASASIEEVSVAVGLSTTPCWRRVRKLEADGYIRKRVALLDPAKLNVGITVFVSIRTSHHDAAWLEKFARGIQRIPEVVEFYRMSGEVDYFLRVVVPDIAAYDAVYKRIIKVAELHDVSSSFAMEKIKYTTSLPLDYVG